MKSVLNINLHSIMLDENNVPLTLSIIYLAAFQNLSTLEELDTLTSNFRIRNMDISLPGSQPEIMALHPGRTDGGRFSLEIDAKFARLPTISLAAVMREKRLLARLRQTPAWADYLQLHNTRSRTEPQRQG